MKQNTDSGQNLVELAETWSHEKIKEKLEGLLDFVHPVLLDESSEYELRLDCVRFTSEKIARLVPVYEAEDKVYYPLLNGVLQFLKQCFATVVRTQGENQVLLLAVATALTDHTNTAIQHVFSLDGLGVGEIPSLLRFMPKILLTSFKYCGENQTQDNSDELKNAIDRLFLRNRTLLENMFLLVDKIQIRSILEDERHILIEFCMDLLAFHTVLFHVDLKSTVGIWKLYLKLLTDHSEKIMMELDVEAALVILIQEVLESSCKLDILLQNNNEDVAKKSKRLTLALIVMVKFISNLSQLYRNKMQSNFEAFVELLGFLFSEGRSICSRIEPTLANKLNQEIFSLGQAELILSDMPDIDKFCMFILKTKPIPSNAFTLIQISINLLQVNQVPASLKVKFIDLIVKSYGSCELEHQSDRRLTSVEVSGSQVSNVCAYEWVLTRVCREISRMGADDFSQLEIVLFENLITDCILTSSLCCDIICFVSRFGTAQLCLSHLQTVCNLYAQLNRGQFSLHLVWLRSLVGRLFNFLGPNERKVWSEKFNPSDASNLVLWSAVDLTVVRDAETIKQLHDTSMALYRQLTGEEVESPVEDNTLVSTDPTMLNYALQIFKKLLTLDSGYSFTDIVLTMWRKIAHSDFVAVPRFNIASMFACLSELTSVAMSKLSLEDLKCLIVCVQIVAIASRQHGENPAYLVANILSIAQAILKLDWLSEVETVETSLITNVGQLASCCVRPPEENPILRTDAAQFVKWLTNQTKSRGFVWMCNGEYDASSYFALLSSMESIYMDPETSLAFDCGAASLESFVNVDSRSSEIFEYPRKIASLSYVEAGDTVDGVLSTLDTVLDQLIQLTSDNPMPTEQQRLRLEKIMEKLAAKSKQWLAS